LACPYYGDFGHGIGVSTADSGCGCSDGWSFVALRDRFFGRCSASSMASSPRTTPDVPHRADSVAPEVPPRLIASGLIPNHCCGVFGGLHRKSLNFGVKVRFPTIPTVSDGLAGSDVVSVSKGWLKYVLLTAFSGQ
jgi:hypothetical protein